MTSDRKSFELSKKDKLMLSRLLVRLKAAGDAVEEALLEYATDLRRIREFRSDLVEFLAFRFDCKSERFQNSRRGREIASLIAAWEDLDLDDPDIDLCQAERIEDQCKWIDLLEA